MASVYERWINWELARSDLCRDEYSRWRKSLSPLVQRGLRSSDVCRRQRRKQDAWFGCRPTSGSLPSIFFTCIRLRHVIVGYVKNKTHMNQSIICYGPIFASIRTGACPEGKDHVA